MNLPEDDSVQALFKRIADNDSGAFKLLFEQYRVNVYAAALKWCKSTFAAEEITQEVFISLWTGRVHLQNVVNPEAYLYMTVYHKISRYLKKELNRQKILALDIWKYNKGSNETEEAVMANDSSRHINTAIEQLSPQKKLIYKLSRQQGKSYAEIAETLNVSPNTVKSQMVKAVKSIRNYLEKSVLTVGCIASLIQHFKR